jgi:hypothetical protein
VAVSTIHNLCETTFTPGRLGPFDVNGANLQGDRMQAVAAASCRETPIRIGGSGKTCLVSRLGPRVRLCRGLFPISARKCLLTWGQRSTSVKDQKTWARQFRTKTWDQVWKSSQFEAPNQRPEADMLSFIRRRRRARQGKLVTEIGQAALGFSGGYQSLSFAPLPSNRGGDVTRRGSKNG